MTSAPYQLPCQRSTQTTVLTLEHVSFAIYKAFLCVVARTLLSGNLQRKRDDKPKTSLRLTSNFNGIRYNLLKKNKIYDFNVCLARRVLVSEAEISAI